MRIVGTSFAAAGAFLLAGVTAGFACDYHASHVTAATPAPAPETTAAPATAVDPVHLANLDKTVILPTTPTGDDANDTAKAD